MKNDVIIKFLLIGILILALGLRIYKLEDVPPSISWDEAAVGYNAYTIANWGMDEYGRFLPLYFRSFGEGKNPVDIYLTALSTKLLDLSEFSTRLPAAVFGVLNVLLLYFLSKTLFKSRLIGLIASLFLAISPYNLHFAHFNHEANIALFFFMSAILLFYLSLNKRKNLIIPSGIAFILSFLSYSASKIVVPIILIVITILYLKQLINIGIPSLISGLILFIFIILIIIHPSLLGITRYGQTAIGDSLVKKTKIYEKTNNLTLGRLEIVFNQYFLHFAPQYLFISGDKNPRLSFQTGQFYKIDVFFLIAGLLYLVHKRFKAGFLVLIWALVGPLPSSVVSDSPHAGRSMFMMGSWHLIAALGLYFIISLVRRPFLKTLTISVTIIILIFLLKDHLNYYYGEYAKRYAIEWQYGMKQIVEFVKDHKEYNQIFMTDARAQPYIFFLYYLKYPLPEYLNSVLYNNSESKSYNNVSNFGRYYFGGWDVTESLPTTNVLYIVTPSQYDGLRHKSRFDVKKVIYYPNNTTAFYLVSAYE